MSEVGIIVENTDETEESKIKYLNINVSDNEVMRNPDVVRLYSDVETLEYVKPKMEHCKDCKFFEYDSVANVDGIPLIVAHEICSRWGDGCKTKENGYCFLFEPKMQEVKE